MKKFFDFYKKMWLIGAALLLSVALLVSAQEQDKKKVKTKKEVPLKVDSTKTQKILLEQKMIYDENQVRNAKLDSIAAKAKKKGGGQ